MTKRESMNVLKDKFTDVGKSNSIKKIRELYKTVKNLPLTVLNLKIGENTAYWILRI